MAWISRLRGMWKREKRDGELDEELRSHIEMRMADSVRAGISPNEARDDARRRFGNFTLQKERTRDMDILGWLETFLQDLRYGLRSLVKNPGLAAVAILTLALGIGANTAIFSVLNGVLLRPLPYPQPDRLYWIWDSQKQLAQAPSSGVEFLAYREQNKTFEQVAATRSLNFNLTGMGDPERVRGMIVSANYFDMLSVQPALGRNFSDADDKEGATRVVLITNGFWQRHFGGDRAILGKTLTIDGGMASIVGVLPADYTPPEKVEFFVNPIYGVPELFSGFGDPRHRPFPHYLNILGRLKPGVTPAQAQADLALIIARFSEQQPASKGHGVALQSLRESIVGNVRPTLFALVGIAGVVLLIACANVANILLARATTREREIAVRAALGATGWRLARQMVTEGALLGLLGGLAALPVAAAGVRAIVLAHPQGLPRLESIQMDSRVLMFAFAIAFMTGILFGLPMAFRGALAAPGDVLKQAGRTSAGGLRQRWLRNALVCSEVALSLALLAGAGLLTRSFVRLLEVKPGFRTDHLVFLSVAFSGPRYSGQRAASHIGEFQSVFDRIGTVPQVESVAAANDVPLESEDTTSYPAVDGPSALAPNEKILVGMHAVTNGYFHAMGIPLLRGREFAPSDGLTAPEVVVINRAFAQRVWPGEDPLGKHIHLFNGEHGSPEEVVGVVDDVKQNGLNAADTMDVYGPWAQQPWPYMNLAIRTPLQTDAILPLVRTAIAQFDPSLPIYEVRTFDDVLNESLGARTVTLALVAVFAVLALMLASIGIYGVMSYTVAARTQELGIRMALGASPGSVFKLVLAQGMRVTGIGIVLGAGAAAELAHYLRTLLFQVQPFDLVTYAATALLLAIVAFVACYIPARRATRVDPLVALRYE
jgi:predicted permease